MEKHPWEEKYCKNSNYRSRYPFDNIVSLVFNKYNNLKRKIRVLELGCGCGNNLIPLSDYFEFAYGIDISETVIKYAQDRAKNENQENFTFIRKDLNDEFQINIPKKFDLIFDRACLSYLLPHRLDALVQQLASNYLEKDGNLFLSLYADTNSSLEINKVNSSNYSEIGTVISTEYYYSRKDLISFKKFNLEIEKFEYISRMNMMQQGYFNNSEWNVLYKRL